VGKKKGWNIKKIIINKEKNYWNINIKKWKSIIETGTIKKLK
jgi:hypothetical protein